MKIITVTKKELRQSSSSESMTDLIKKKLDGLGLHKRETVQLTIKRFQF